MHDVRFFPLRRPMIQLYYHPGNNALQVSGADADALERAIAPWRGDPGLRWRQAEPGLEDAFIALMARSKDELQ